jgi:ADP-heptose:LPS heptosyltransferase
LTSSPHLLITLKEFTMKSILIIQTAFIGDVILATPLIEKLHQQYPDAAIDFLLRKGNEGLLNGHPLLRQVLIWDKKQGKYVQLLHLIKLIRSNHYDYVINLQRFFTTGLITTFSGAHQTIGFAKNPLSLFFTKRFPHTIDTANGKVHEVDRNLSLITHLTNNEERMKPRLYPGDDDYKKIKTEGAYITISPTSVWFTKQYPREKWVALINITDPKYKIFLLGGKTDADACEWIKQQSTHPRIEVMGGQLDFLASAALMQHAVMNYVNDSAPLHLASAVDAPVTAIFCSTIPAFGFGPLSSNSHVIETTEQLECRPCGLHGYKVCPKGHFKCADISAERIITG